VIPVVYNLLDRRADAWYQKRGARNPRQSEGAHALAEGSTP
jgi:hypothetical protein